MTIPRILTALILATTVSILTAHETAAHAALLRSDPPASAALDSPPAEIRLWFSEPLETSYTGADLLDADGTAVPGTTVAIDPDNHRQLVIAPPPNLPRGAYTVAWRTLSAADGHTLQGYFGFQIGASVASAVVSPPEGTPVIDTVRGLTRGLALIALAALLAVAPLMLWVLAPVSRAVPTLGAGFERNLRRFVLVAAVAAVLANIAALAAQAAAIAPASTLLVAVADIVRETRYGALWLLRMLLLLLVIAALVVALRERGRMRSAALALSCLLSIAAPVPFSLISHAAAQVNGRAFAVAADALHLLFAAVWGGGPLILATVLMPVLRRLPRDERLSALRIAIPRFSAIAVAAWGILVFTGLYASWLHVGTLDALRETTYGQALMLKGTLLVPVLALAGFHFRFGQGAFTRGDPASLARTVAVEALLVVAVLLVVGRLIGLEPAREVAARQQPAGIRASLTFATDEGARSGQLVIDPGAVGPNTLTIEVGGPPLPADAEGVLRFAPVGRDMGAQELTLPADGPNRFRASGSELALPGEWQIEVIVRKIGTFSWATTLSLPVEATPPAAPDVNPAPRFSPPGVAGMVVAAFGFAALSVAAAIGGVGGTRRTSLAAAGIALVVVGALVMTGSRLVPETAAPGVAASVDSSMPAPEAPSPASDLHEDHATPDSARLAASALPQAGTPISDRGLTIALLTNPKQPGPTDLTVAVTNLDGAPLAGARVTVLTEMGAMSMDPAESPAIETAPGRYLAKDVPLSMRGDWHVSVRVSPRGEPTTIVRFLVPVP